MAKSFMKIKIVLQTGICEQDVTHDIQRLFDITGNVSLFIIHSFVEYLHSLPGYK